MCVHNNPSRVSFRCANRRNVPGRAIRLCRLLHRRNVRAARTKQTCRRSIVCAISFAAPWDRRRLLRDAAEDVCCVDKIIGKVTARCSMQPSHSCVAAASGTGVVLGAGHIQHLLAADARICSTARRRVKYLSKRTRKTRAAS